MQFILNIYTELISLCSEHAFRKESVYAQLDEKWHGHPIYLGCINEDWSKGLHRRHTSKAGVLSPTKDRGVLQKLSRFRPVLVLSTNSPWLPVKWAPIFPKYICAESFCVYVRWPPRFIYGWDHRSQVSRGVSLDMHRRLASACYRRTTARAAAERWVRSSFHHFLRHFPPSEHPDCTVYRIGPPRGIAA